MDYKPDMMIYHANCADDFYDRLRTALPARGLKLVEVGDAD